MSGETYRLPAEWEKHRATWIVWPQNRYDWYGKFAPIKWVYAEIVKNLTKHELTRILVDSKKVCERAKKTLLKVGVDISKVEFFEVETNRGWIRDFGPFFVRENNSQTKILDFAFNGWKRYSNWDKDNLVPFKIADLLYISSKRIILNSNSVVLEGGSVDVNGAGLLLTTEQCLLNSTEQIRNEGFNKKDYETLFRNCFGVKRVIWLEKGISGDDTNGHVDDFCRFVNENTVVICREDKPIDDNYFALNTNRERLKDDCLLEIVDLPMPNPLFFDNCRLPASYANFYISNCLVLVPTYNDVNDYRAIGVLSELFPDREVIGINSVDLILGLGAIHCLTKEQPI